MMDQLETQIGGKYGPENPKLFTLKGQLEAQGIGVLFPAGDAVIEEGDFALTDPSEKDIPWHKTEFGFLRSVSANPIHIIANANEGREGYLGESASAEVAYAILKGKPIIMLYEPVVGEHVSPRLGAIITAHMNQLTIHDISTLSGPELRSMIEQTIASEVDYQLTEEEETIIREELSTLLRNIRNMWKASQVETV